jgi:hypothetical protein
MPPMIAETSNILRIYDAFDDDQYFEVNQKRAGDLDAVLSPKFARSMNDFIATIYCFHMTGFPELEEKWTEDDKKFYKSKKKHVHRLKTSHYDTINAYLNRINF